MFHRIGSNIALRFTVFVFVLFIVNGVVFLAADFGNARREARFRLDRTLGSVMEQLERMPMIAPADLPPPVRDHLRVLDALGEPLFSPPLYDDVPFVPAEGYSEVFIEGEPYRMLTARVRNRGQTVGYVQIADVERLPLSGIPLRAILYFVVSIIVSALTYLIGTAFARSSLRPAKEMMERLEQFTQDASHELRTPIAALNSSLDLALRNHKYREGIESAKEDLKEVSGLVERLLDLARLDRLAIEPQAVDMSALTEDAIERHRPLAAETSVVIEGAVAPKIRVRCDAPLVRQLLGNLIGNAIKFNRRGGTVRVRLAKDHLAVEDTGIGIAAEALPQIFNRFYQADTSRAKEGFGLGLAFVRRVADIHGWHVSVQSKEGKGTTFTVKFS